MRKWTAALAVLLNIFTVSAQIEWNDSTSTGWGEGPGVDINPNKPTGKVTQLSLSSTRLLLSGGETAQLVAIVNTDAANKSVKWRVADESIASVSSNGLVTAMTTGQTVVTATSVDGGLAAQCLVTVKNNALVYVERIELDKSEVTLYVGDACLVTPTVYPANVTNKEVVWNNYSPSTDYLPCDNTDNGYFTGVRPGVFTYEVRPADGADVVASVKVTVKDRPVTSMKLPSSITLGINEMKNATVEVTPQLVQPKFAWKVADPSIAFVTGSGRIIGRKPGETTLTATATDGTGISCTCQIVVTEQVADWGYSGWVLERGETIRPWTARCFNHENPDDAPQTDNKGHKWYELGYDDSDWQYGYGPVSNWIWRGGNSPEEYNSFGQWTYSNSDYYLRQEFYLPDVKGYDIKIYCNAEPDKVLYVNGKRVFITDVSDGYDHYKGSYMAQLDASVLNLNGMNVIALKVMGRDIWGIRYIDFGLHYERSILTTRVILSQKSLSLPRFATEKLTATVKPNEVTRPELRWSSSDENIASVEQDGTITSLRPGTTIISATSTDGSNKSGQCTVTVTDAFGDNTDLIIAPGGSHALYFHQSKSLSEPKDAEGHSFKDFDFDDSAWTDCDLPLVGENKKGPETTSLDDTDHRYYIRRHIDIPELSGNYVLFCECSHNGAYTVTFNGHSIQGTWGWYDYDTYEIPNDYIRQNGDNVLSLSYDHNGDDSYIDYKVWLHKIIPVSTINLNKTSLTLDQQQEERLTVDVLPTDAYNRSVKWTSSAPTVATVDDGGNVKALGEGTATITVAATDGSGVSASCLVTVTNKMPVERWIKPMGTEQPWTARYVYCLEGESDYTNGPKGDKSGRGWISPLYDDSSWGTITGPIGHDVSEHYETYWPDHHSRYYLREKFTLDDVSSLTNPTLYVLHDDGVKIWINNQLVRETGDCIMGEYIDIPSNTLVSGENTICIQVSEGDGGAYIDYGLKVTEKIEIVPVSAVTVDKSSLTLKINEKQQLSATLQPSNAYYKDIAWESSDNTVAVVNQEGYVKALAPGTAVITAYNTHGKRFEAQCRVTVTNEIAPLQAGDWIITTGEEDEWPAKALYARSGEALFETEPAADANGNKWTELDHNDAEWTDIVGPLDKDNRGNWPDDNSRYYVRRYFTAGNLSEINSVKLYVKHDDNALVYLNGIKVAECPDWSNNEYREYLLPKNLLHNGKNVICVNIYQGSGGAHLYFGLKASDDDGAPKPVSSVKFTNDDVSISLGKSKKLSLTVEPDNVFSKEMYWSSSNPEVATVDGNGRVSAISLGTTVITAVPKFGNEGVMAQCKVTVIESSTSSNSLPDISFEFNFNAKDYDENEHCIANNDDAALAEYNLQLSENIPVYDASEGSLDIQDICCGWIDKWERESRESGEYFYRSGQDDMTIICKVAPKLNAGSCDFISNRAGGYNYMFRIGDRNRFYLHTGTAYQDDRSIPLQSEEEQVLAVRVNSSENYIQLDNITTLETLKMDNVNWGGGNNAFKMFYNDGGEYYKGKFFWVYYSKEYLEDDDLQSVADFNEAYGTIVGDVNADGKVTVADLTTLINILLINQQATNKKADVNGDGNVNTDDIRALRDILLEKTK